MSGIVWLASYPESGNKLTQSLLHNLIVGRPEGRYINQHEKSFHFEANSEWFEDKVVGTPQTVTPELLAHARPKVQAVLSELNKGSSFVSTHNCLGAWYGQPLINAAVTAAAIYTVRNPLDIAVSMLPYFNQDVDLVIKQINDAQAMTNVTDRHVPEVLSSWSGHVGSWVAQPSKILHVVKYEDYLDDMAGAFQGILDFLKLTPDEDRLARTLKNGSLEASLQHEKTGGFSELRRFDGAFFQYVSQGRWRELFSEEQIKQIISAHRPMMEKFDYIPEGY